MFQSNPNSKRNSFSLSLSLPLSRVSSATGAKRSLHSPASRDGTPSPHSPLIPSPSYIKDQPFLPVPDGLDATERMKLLKKTRKLSRILGEVPIPVSIEEASELRLLRTTEEPQFTSKSRARSPPGINLINTLTLKRSVTVDYHKQAHESEIQRARSLASLRPSLSILPSTASRKHSNDAVTPKDVPPLPASPISPTSPALSIDTVVGPPRRDSLIYLASRLDSPASPTTPQQREQLQRTRVAKLASHSGDDVPPEMLVHATSPTPAEAQSPPRRSSSTRHGNGSRSSHKRRLSLDVRSLVRGSDVKGDAPVLSDPARHRALLKKSGSLARRPGTGSTVDSRRQSLIMQDSDVDSDLEGNDSDTPLSLERQRALNVRRARKMNQLFGNDPPPALFQITNISPARVDDTSSTFAHRRHSCATFASATPSNFSIPEPDDGRRNSEASSGDNLSPLVFAEADSVPPSISHTPVLAGSAEGDRGSEVLPYLKDSDSTAGMRPSSPFTSPSQHSIASAFSTTPSWTLPLPSPTHTTFRPSPPPFATMFKWEPSNSVASAMSSPPIATFESTRPPPETTGPIDPSDPAFRTRRIRAAKLSRFFGVGLQDIAGVLVGNGSTPSVNEVAVGPTSPPPHLPPPPVPSLYSSFRTDSTDTIATPSSPTTSSRPFTGRSDEGAESLASSRSLKRSGSRRSQSATRNARRAQAQLMEQSQMLAVGPGAESRDGSNSEPEVPVHGRSFSTTVEIAAERRGKYFNFLEGRKAAKGKELEMHHVIEQLRKIK